MKNGYLFSLFLIILFLSACHFKQNKLIKNYELSTYQIKVVSIESVDSFRPFYAYDSIRILELQYDSVYKYKLESLNYQLNMLSQKIEKIELEVEAIKNPLMVNAIENRLKLIYIEKESIEKVLLIYKNTPEKTQLSLISERINYLKMVPDSVLGYTLRVNFTAKQGALPLEMYERNYFFNSEKDCVLGVFKE